MPGSLAETLEVVEMEWLIKVGAKVSYHSRRWYVHAASAFPLVRNCQAVFG